MIEKYFRCTQCAKEYAISEVRYLCPKCSASYSPGIPLLGVLEVCYDYDLLKKKWDAGNGELSIFSPVEKKYYPPFPMAATPFSPVARLGKSFQLRNLWIKNDGLLPSGSLKDRASFMMVAEANRINEEKIVTASTGNAASALAAVCASAGKKAVIFVPEKAPKAKLLQMILYGAAVIPVKGTYDDAFRLSMEYTTARGGLNRNTAYHPLTIEGKKSAALEIFLQNGQKVPDVVIVPVGDGAIIAGVWKGFSDLLRSKITSSMPRLIGVQAKTSDALCRYFHSGKYSDAVNPVTIADSISVSIPSNAHMAVKSVRETGGTYLTVTDEEILAAQSLLARTSGIFAEPSSSSTVAALQKLISSKLIDAKEQIVLLLTGNGLKDIEAPMRNITVPSSILPSMDAVPV